MRTAVRAFRKQITCPSSETLLEYSEQSLSPLASERVRRHLSRCDFCDAEQRFLSRYRPLDEASPSATMPAHMAVTAHQVVLRKSFRKKAQRAA